jgi:hypothetical protein
MVGRRVNVYSRIDWEEARDEEQGELVYGWKIEGEGGADVMCMGLLCEFLLIPCKGHLK